MSHFSLEAKIQQSGSPVEMLENPNLDRYLRNAQGFLDRQNYEAAIKVLPTALARGELGHHYRKGWDAANQVGRPQFNAPVQRLPEHPVPGDLTPLRSGAAP